MNKVSIRELCRHVGAWLRRVQREESLEVTPSGRAGAWRALARNQDFVAHLEADGTLSRGDGDLLEVEPLPKQSEERTLSEILGEMRVDER